MTEIMVITGGSRGIGAATARMASERGYRVCVNYRANEEAASHLLQEIEQAGGKGIAVQGDMAVDADIERLFDTVEQRLGTPTAFINNAGITGIAGRLDDADPGMIRRVIDLNVTGVILAGRAAVRRMSTKHGGRGGGIVNVSSGAATLGSPGSYVWYAASKAAVDAFTLGLAKEVVSEGLRVNGVAPGIVATEIHADSGRPDRVQTAGPLVPMGRIGRAEEIAEAILWLLSDAASYITGETLRVSGGL